ncbi:MAG: MFS transporter [Candidatus Binatus sp.]
MKPRDQTWNRQQRLIVASLFLTLFLVFGSGFNTAGVFFEPLLRQFQWTRARLSSLQTVLGLSAGVSAPFFGWLLDRVDASVVIASGVCVSGAAFLLASRANSYDTFVIAYAMLGVGIAAATLLPCSQVLANWFGERRGTALGLAMSGASLGGMLMTLVAADAIGHAGWRTAYVALALPMLLINVPIVLAVVRTRPETGALAEAPSSASGLEISAALRGRSFWMIAAVQFAFAFAITGGSLHMVPYLIGIGYAPTHAALVLSLTFGLAALGKPLSGAIADRISGRLALAISMAIAAAGQIILLGARNVGLLAAYTVIFGLASGAPLALVPDLTADSLGLKRFGTLLGLSGVFTTIGAATGPVAAGSLYDAAHNYVAAFVIFAAVLVAGGLATLGCVPLTDDAQVSPEPE